MRLIELQRTTSFRLAALFVAIFGCVSVLLFSYLYLAITGFETDRVDDWLQREYVAMAKMTQQQMEARFRFLSISDPTNHLANGLFAQDGRYIQGSLTAPPIDVNAFGAPFSARLHSTPGAPFARCIALQFKNGAYAMRCQDTAELQRFSDKLLHTLLFVGGMTFLLVLLGSLLFSMRAMRRLNAVTDSITRIVAGDLSQRLPTRRSEDDIERLIRVVNHMLQEIERLMSEVKGVCDYIAHDLRTPLTRMITGIERTLSHSEQSTETADCRAALEKTRSEATGMLRTFNGLLRISEIESGARRRAFRSVDLASLVRDVFEYYDPCAEEKSIKFKYQIDDEASYEIDGDPNLLFDALANVVENAIKFAPCNGEVSLSLASRVDGFVLAVIDNGPGISDNERKAVTGRFYRGEASRHSSGNGLGLSLANAVATMHGMRLGFDRTAAGCRVVFEPQAAGGV